MRIFTGSVSDVFVSEPDAFVHELDMTARAKRHSPTGFAWGYGGSGPAALAHSLLTSVMGESYANAHYMQYKWDVIAILPQDRPWTMTDQEIKDWAALHP